MAHQRGRWTSRTSLAESAGPDGLSQATGFWHASGAAALRPASRLLAVLESRPLRWRIHAAYGIWCVCHLPMFWTLWQLIGEWTLFRISLLAIVLSWDLSDRRHRGQAASDPVGPIDRRLAALGVAAAAASFLLQAWPTLAAAAAVLSLLTIRMGLTRESFRAAVAGGLAPAVLFVPLPLPVLEAVAGHLVRLHGPLTAAALEWLTGSEVIYRYPQVVLANGQALLFLRACAGVASLLGLLALAIYLAGEYRHRLGTALLLMVTAAVLAIALNAVRIVITGVCTLGETPWADSPRHELLGIVLFVLGYVLLRPIARHLVRVPSQPAQPPAA